MTESPTGDWQLISTARNPWGKVPITGGDPRSGVARERLDELMAQAHQPDPPSRRHHYVPKSYMKYWSEDGKRVHTIDTILGHRRLVGLRDACVAENFYRVVGVDGTPHNRVELMYAVLDRELARIQAMLCRLTDPEQLTFEDFMSLGLLVSVQRGRTSQMRRQLAAQGEWWRRQGVNGQKTEALTAIQLAGSHTESAFTGMYDAADVMTGKQLEIWIDPKGRFITSDAPVQTTLIPERRPGLLDAPRIWWSISPERAVCLVNTLTGNKADMRTASVKQLDEVRTAMIRGRERVIIGTERGLHGIPLGPLPKRTQMRLRCTPHGTGCLVEIAETYASAPDVRLCSSGIHTDVPGVVAFA
ncbi:DUF4238 domain-containing protein [Oerskovia rustica]|uniref:DUF4238 domain-containing protein n=1 Tax=Oerskovia rustica TaxID=2762237 RepID=A0ABR8RPB6_9CELL|nr:DUF4238 domain-containing protein [Oerskovia rustica]MBD7949606.1 DUF4238 domain-containing protein [Oerskovia rustica]